MHSISASPKLCHIISDRLPSLCQNCQIWWKFDVVITNIILLVFLRHGVYVVCFNLCIINVGLSSHNIGLCVTRLSSVPPFNGNETNIDATFSDICLFIHSLPSFFIPRRFFVLRSLRVAGVVILKALYGQTDRQTDGRAGCNALCSLLGREDGIMSKVHV